MGIFSLLSMLKTFLYKLLTRTHILYYTIPLQLPLMHMFVINPRKKHNHVILDGKGNGIMTCKVKSRYYPSIGEWRVNTFSDIEIRDSDVILCGYPKTGSNWTYEILNMILTGKAKLSRFGKGLEGMMDMLPDYVLDSLISPRILSTHYPFDELPKQSKTKKTKIVLTIRNPKDTVVSYYNHFKSMPFLDYHGEFDDYFELFMKGEVWFGSYFDSVLAWDKCMKTQTTNKILVVEFEKLKSDPVKEIMRMARFLEIDISDEFAEEISCLTTFQSLKTLRANSLIAKKIYRKGIVGDWKNWLTKEQSDRIDKMWQERMLGSAYQPHY